MSAVEALARAHRAVSHPNDPRCDHPDLHTNTARALLSNLSTADRLEVAGITPRRLDEAMVAVWPSHSEGMGGTGDAPTEYWPILDPAVPSLTIAGQVLAALATTPVSDDTEGAG